MIDRINLYMKERASLFPEDPVIFLFINSKNVQLTSRKIYTIVKKYLSLVTTADRKSPHVLRHSFATHLTNNGAELNAVKELLGHSSLASTQVYTHNSIERLRDIHKKAHPKG
jgi:integrase/recombinase XerC